MKKRIAVMLIIAGLLSPGTCVCSIAGQLPKLQLGKGGSPKTRISGGSATAETQVSTGAAPDSGQSVGGAGTRTGTHGRGAKETSAAAKQASSGSAGTLAGPGLTTGGGGGGGGGTGTPAPGAGALRVYDSFAAVPCRRCVSSKDVIFSKEGDGVSVRFKAEGQHINGGYGGSWSWVETVSSSSSCMYKAWLSRQAKGTAVSGCGPATTQYTGGNIGWQAGGTPLWWQRCILDSGGLYYFNLMLFARGAESDSCQEYIQPN